LQAGFAFGKHLLERHAVNVRNKNQSRFHPMRRFFIDLTRFTTAFGIGARKFSRRAGERRRLAKIFRVFPQSDGAFKIS
jgi:hypothetical protein